LERDLEKMKDCKTKNVLDSSMVYKNMEYTKKSNITANNQLSLSADYGTMSPGVYSLSKSHEFN
jgi:hypothetical protein